MAEKHTKTNKTIRPPVVVILGHVDHGKTSLLDFIRKTRVAAKEAGGITQHIGAYQAEAGGPSASSGSKKITFLDTPGHEAFSAIRSRGCKVADIAVLVVATDEGIKPQTKEAIKIIKEAKTPFIVALNKIDKEGSNPQRVRQELAEQEVLVEGYGGNIPIAEVSAKTGAGIDHLLELISLTAELEELSASDQGPAKGIVLESHHDSRRGTVVTLIVQEGKLESGNWLAAGNSIARIKSLENFLGKPANQALPSEPCVATGWETPPGVGFSFEVFEDRSAALKSAEAVTTIGPAQLFAKEISSEEQKTPKRVANLIIKADVQSSLEAIDHILRTIHSEEVDYKVVAYGVGKITDADIKKARSTSAAVVGFHVDMDSSAKQMAEREQVRVESHSIIYELVEVVRSIMSDLLDPEVKRIPVGKMKILASFEIGLKSQIVGGKVTQGKIIRGSLADVIRNNTIVFTGKIGQLQHNKADVSEVTDGLEAGIRFDAPIETLIHNIRVGDILDVYQEERIKRSI